MDAKGLVARLRPQAQFEAMLTDATQRAQTFLMASARNPSRAERNRSEASAAAVRRYGPLWEQNLVDSWATLDAAELEQVCVALARRDRETFGRFATRVGAIAEARNRPLLLKAGSDVLATVWDNRD